MGLLDVFKPKKAKDYYDPNNKPSAPVYNPNPTAPMNRANSGGGVSSGGSKKTAPTPLNKFEPEIQRDANGKAVGVTLPDGRIFTNLSAAQISGLINDWNGSAKGQVQQKAPGLTQDQQLQAEIDRAKRKAELEAAGQPPNVTQAQLLNVGIPGSLDQNNPITENIQQNVAARQAESLAAQIPVIGGLANVNKAVSLGTGLLNGVFPGSGTALINALGQTEAGRQYLNDYNNGDNFRSVQKNIDLAQSRIALAIKVANQPGNSDEAIRIYNDAWARIYESDAQLKMIEQNDQRAYVHDVKNQRTEIAQYIADNKPLRDAQMRNALIRPDPTYYDGQIEQILAGGSQ